MHDLFGAYWLILCGVGCIVGLAMLAGSIACFVRYSRTRKLPYLIAGILLALIIPGILLLVLLGMWIPSTVVVYGPPPPTMVVYGPPSDIAP